MKPPKWPLGLAKALIYYIIKSMKMKIPAVKLDGCQIFTLMALFGVGFGWISLILAWTGLFYPSFLVIFGLAGSAILIYLVFLNRKSLRLNLEFFLIFLLLIFSIFIFSLYSTHTVFSGRDQGSLSEAAIRLSQDHRLESSFPAEKEFFKIYGPGKALNFPGFHYTEDGNLKTSFPIGYIAWLGSFYSLFGINGFLIAQSIAFLFFSSSIFLLSRIYLKFYPSLILLVLTLSSFIFSWFFKFTLSENLALMLLWFGIYEMILFLKNEKIFFLIASFLSLSLLSFVRIEGIAFLAMAGIVLLYQSGKSKTVFSILMSRKTVQLVAAFAFLYAVNLFINKEFFLTITKGALDPILSYKEDFGIASGFFASLRYLISLLLSYNLLAFIVLGIAGFVYLAKSKSENFVLIPFLIVLPSFIYLINPSISPDHPWMLRRFLFSIIPVCILYSVLFFRHFFEKKVFFYSLSLILLALNVSTSYYFLPMNPNRNLLAQVEEFGGSFGKNDLILIDRKATGDGWAMMTAPLDLLFGKQAVYFFNPDDLKKIDLNKFENAYIIIPNENLEIYEKILPELSAVKEFSITNRMLDVPIAKKTEAYSSSIQFPRLTEKRTEGKIYLVKK